MECVIEANAMKKSFYHQGFVAEEVMGNGNTNCGFGADDSFVDEFLNFSKEEEQDAEEFVEGEEEAEKDSVSVSSQENSVEVSFKDAFDSLGSELCVPTDDLADLEWVSRFVDDSFNEEEFSFSCPKTTPTPNQEFKTQTPKESKSFSSVQEQQISGISSLKTFSIPPKRSRTKRTRTTNGRRIWPLGSPPSFSESSSTTTSSSSTSSSSPTSCLIFSKPQTLDFIYYLPEKKKQKPKSKSYEDQNPQFQQQLQHQRRCSHCGVQKTPQWRTGPMGAKTLCNACGVRFKSGRLLPEYRPACSPTFSNDVHSNNHRKVLEMRKKKETIPGSDSGMVPAVHSF